ncbi:K(+)-transporting ATPase subunit C [Mucilaginibacter phyllosphaerae]|uniref:Potassium-transporting ATPase KdpC subunit n=1 Tax=Mucilaginibacter phyllosphaerae TaxID=1812349 RepID=A0A4Y8AB79_9SPHI|nr:K(+)-transporting ATPase subunit C [Mucilaginibacter phyllosphaerae]MBB3969410.1 K+-transporting ATPase ATPase C chain [Mucilaginibacter phyllosphaerae]TEW65804.1 K(+)-transporting ATPase subunit C [Mucilaginibacter phyllosphaerae]GGH08329.1 potassium-transporting ATPase KdpC subunit [Mucilaginibacter phyllosphaerae]
MKSNLIKSIRVTLILIVILCVLYPLAISVAGKLSKGHGDGETITLNGKVVGYANIGQSFTQPKYFWGRPSAVGYNAAGSGGSNKGPSNPDYLKDVNSRIDTLLKYHPYLKRADIPAEMVTASGSGLDPDISPLAAKIQIERVAKVRNLTTDAVAALVNLHTEKPLFGLFGPAKVNVLKLNVALDELKKQN